MKTTKVDFVNKKVISNIDEETGKSFSLEKRQLMFVDFKSKKLKNCLDAEVYVEIEEDKSDVSNFEEMHSGSPWANYSNLERVQHSDYLLQYFSDLAFSEILYFINMGILDKKKVAEKLNIPYNTVTPDNIG